MIWSIWKARNDYVFRDVAPDTDIIIIQGLYFFTAYRDGTRVHPMEDNQEGEDPVSEHNSRWTPPARNEYKINTDGACKDGRITGGSYST